MLKLLVCTETVSGKSSTSSDGSYVTGAGVNRHIRINSTPIREGPSGSHSVGVRPFMYTDEKDEVVSSKDHPRQLLMFHGVILRSQLTVLLKHKVFFCEDDRVG